MKRKKRRRKKKRKRRSKSYALTSQPLICRTYLDLCSSTEGPDSFCSCVPDSSSFLTQEEVHQYIPDILSLISFSNRVAIKLRTPKIVLVRHNFVVICDFPMATSQEKLAMHF